MEKEKKKTKIEEDFILDDTRRMLCKYKMDEFSAEITYDCPMNCIHCSSRAGSKNDIQLPTELILNMIKQCKEHCGTTCVSLSGGEPFQHPDFWKIVRYIDNIKLKPIIYSCGIMRYSHDLINPTPEEMYYGSFTSNRIDALHYYNCKLIISLHGTPEKHNKMMDIGENAFTYATRTIKEAVERGIEVEIHFVPTKINYKDIEIVYGICVALGVSKMSILRYVPQGRGLENEKEGERLNLTREEFMELNKTMKYIKRLDKKRMTEFRIGIPADFTFLIDQLDGENNIKKEKACTGGKTKILVKADGKVQVCPAWKELNHLSAGDVYKENIIKIWRKGKTYIEFREFTKEKLEEPCKSCKFVDSCLGGCTAQRILNSTMELDGMSTAPDPLCFLDLIEKERIKKMILNKGIIDD